MGGISTNRMLLISLASFSIIISSLTGCGGSTTGGDVQDFQGTQFVSDDGTTGSLMLELDSSEIDVSQTTGFMVRVVNSEGEGVSGISVACDSEDGVALIDPTTGRSMTNSEGYVSGVIGCESPGSFQMGCRVAGGANSRSFAGVRCQGNVPAGFEGFPGAGGGGLGGGGGVVSPENGGPGQSDGLVRISDIQVDTINAEPDAVPEIDTVQSICDNGTPTDVTDDFSEPYSYDEVVITIENNSPRTVTFTGFDYIVKGGKADGSEAVSPRIRDFAQSVAQSGKTVTLSAHIFEAATGGKTYGDGATFIPTRLGRANVRITVYGVDDLGQPVQATASSSMAFDNFNNCDSGE